MFALRSRISPFGATLATLLSLATLSTAGHAYTQDEQAACTGDAFRICGAEIPDVDRVTACMVRNKAQLSPACRVFFRSAGPAEAVSESIPPPKRKRIRPRARPKRR